MSKNTATDDTWKLDKTIHHILNADSRKLPISESSIDLVVTSPPYPMIEMWDELFKSLDESDKIAELLEDGDGDGAFNEMHTILKDVWKELYRVTRSGGIVCINMGRAKRSIGGSFKTYDNVSRVVENLKEVGFDQLPGVKWKKPSNNPNSFMGSSPLPVNGYVTDDHEGILIFRKSPMRSFDGDEKERRGQSCIFFNERNKWFSDYWEIDGVRQSFTTISESEEHSVDESQFDFSAPRFNSDGSGNVKLGVYENDEEDPGRLRTAAYPLEVPYRLISMYSIYGDRILDPFAGTGTTTIAAMALGRDSISVDVDRGCLNVIKNRIYDTNDVEVSPTNKSTATNIENFVEDKINQRFGSHRKLVATKDKNKLYESKNHPFNVVTKMERELKFYNLKNISQTAGTFECEYEKRRQYGTQLADFCI